MDGLLDLRYLGWTANRESLTPRAGGCFAVYFVLAPHDFFGHVVVEPIAELGAMERENMARKADRETQRAGRVGYRR